MAKYIQKLFIIFLSYLIMKSTKIIQGQPQVPCLYLFGDSLFDNGNNNNLNTKAKVNYFPYGIDYPGGVATGRFSNGKNIPDFLAGFLGLNESVPPFATANGAEIVQGVNYASGAAGIFDDTGNDQGEHISLNEQLANHGSTTSKIAELMGNDSSAQEHLQQCLYVVCIGNNDYLNNYLVPQYSAASNLYTPQQFAALLINQYSQQLTTLYNYGARKVAVFGISVIGCIPHVMPKNGTCVQSINEMAQQYNRMLEPLLMDLNNNLKGAVFTYINLTSITSGDPALLGIRVTNTSCCLVKSKLTGLCVGGTVPCNNRNMYEFWDNFHPTEKSGREVAARAYNALLPSDAYPFDIHHLIQKFY